MNAVRITASTLLVALLAGCQPNAASDAKLREQADAIESLKTQLGEVKETADSAKFVANLAFGMPTASRTARLTPGDTGYSEVNAGLMNLALTLENVEQFASGTRITVLIGNPSNADVNQLYAKLAYGPFSEEFPTIPDSEKQKTKEWTIVKDIPSGSWSRHTVTLDGVKPEDFGYVELSEVNAKGISLRRAL